MAELATIARPYAEALFKASTSTAGVDLNATAGWLDELAAIAADAQLKQFAESPKVSAQQVFDLVAGLTKYVLPDQGKNFLRTVIDNGRLQALPEVAAQFRKLVNAERFVGCRCVQRIPDRWCCPGRPRRLARKAFWPQAQPDRRNRQHLDWWCPCGSG